MVSRLKEEVGHISFMLELCKVLHVVAGIHLAYQSPLQCNICKWLFEFVY